MPDNSNKKLKILLATGIFPPDIGGPATYAKILSEELGKYNDINLLSFGDSAIQSKNYQIHYISRKVNILRRYWYYFLRAYKLSSNSDIIYAFDLLSVGLPCALVKVLCPKVKLIVRLGGDYQWERAVENGYFDRPLEDYYAEKKFCINERIIYLIISFVLKKCDLIVFNSVMLKNLYLKYRKVNEVKTVIIRNIKKINSMADQVNTDKSYLNIIFAGRLIKVRNLKRLIEAFSQINTEKTGQKINLELVGDGPERQNLFEFIKEKKMDDKVKIIPAMEYGKLQQKIFNSDIAISVCLTDINPNFIIEALLFGKLVVLTDKTESFYMGIKDDLLFYIDPMNVDDIKNKLNMAIEAAAKRKNVNQNFNFAENKIQELAWSLEKVCSEHSTLFNKLASK